MIGLRHLVRHLTFGFRSLPLFFGIGTGSLADELKLDITDQYKIIGDRAMSVLVEVLDENSRNVEFELKKEDEGPGEIFVPLSPEHASKLPTAVLCFRIDEVDGYDGLLILRKPCHPSRGRKEFSLTVKKPEDYADLFRQTTRRTLSKPRGSIKDFQKLHDDLSVFHLTQPPNLLTIKDVRLYSSFVNYVATKAPYVEDSRFFSLDVFNNPLSSLSNSEYMSANVFDYLEAEVERVDQINGQLEKAVAELFLEFQRFTPERFVIPGTLQDERTFYSELFGLVLALDELKPGGFEVARITPLQRYSEKCHRFGFENSKQRDLCLTPLLNNVQQIDIIKYREVSRRTTATKIAQSIDCDTVGDDIRSGLSNFFTHVLKGELCGEKNSKCSPSVKRCLDSLEES